MQDKMSGLNSKAFPSYAQPIQGFQPLKAAQLCAFFASLSKGHIEKLKLIKLIYLTERKFLNTYSEPILWDEFFSLPHGPICSATLNCIDGLLFEQLTSQYFVRQGNRNIHAVKIFPREDLDALSEAEIETAEFIWREHGSKSASKIRNYSHENCPEYYELETGRRPITYQEVLSAEGNPYSEEIAEEILSYRSLIAEKY
ncbi:MAG: SocA family protein [Rhodobacteraceae bacterium]|nr:SocA family protein [Paracoccaceae bacterium]